MLCKSEKHQVEAQVNENTPNITPLKITSPGSEYIRKKSNW